ncbi:MAG: hypothetical protein FWD42_02150 [Solirubrobacterales bacterium]|nr:hypothetical protein [Solirubrobacterales bacterium]
MAGGFIRVTIGFQGGQVLPLRVAEEQVKRLHDAVEGGGWFDIDSEDGRVRVDLSQVVYVRSDSEEPRVGFGA